jgi:hypothetical protein
MYNIVQLGCLFSKLPRLFINFSSAIVVIFYCDVVQNCTENRTGWIDASHWMEYLEWLNIMLGLKIATLN